MTEKRIIENIWCLECNEIFFAERDKNHNYECPMCNKTINFEKENMRYIVNK